MRAKLIYLNDAMQQEYVNVDKQNAIDKEFDRLRTRTWDCHLELEGRRTRDIVGVGESYWEEWELVIGREALRLRGVEREALQIVIDWIRL